MSGLATHIHIDPLGGVAGDMIAAALLDALPDRADWAIAQARLVVPERFASIHVERSWAQGLAALTFQVRVAAPGGPSKYIDMAKSIGEAELSHSTRDIAHSILHRLAAAEADIHGVPIESVHFHEIAGWDTLADVTVAAALMGSLGDARFSVGALPLGGGVIASAHGLLPVPAPATAALLQGFAWRDDGVSGERVTPTGAAILSHVIATAPGPRGGTLISSGVGSGTKRLDGIPNVTRVLLFERNEPAIVEEDTVAVIEFEIDDMTGEEMATALDHIRSAAGTIDASHDQRIGKKGRPMFGVRVLARPTAIEDVIEACLTETSTLGVRHRTSSRRVLTRSVVEREVAGRDMAVKVATRPDGARTIKVEHDAIGATPTLAARRRLRAAAEEPK